VEEKATEKNATIATFHTDTHDMTSW